MPLCRLDRELVSGFYQLQDVLNLTISWSLNVAEPPLRFYTVSEFKCAPLCLESLAPVDEQRVFACVAVPRILKAAGSQGLEPHAHGHATPCFPVVLGRVAIH